LAIAELQHSNGETRALSMLRSPQEDAGATFQYAPHTLWRITDSHGRTLDAIFIRTA